jgi:hypothetical protein
VSRGLSSLRELPLDRGHVAHERRAATDCRFDERRAQASDEHVRRKDVDRVCARELADRDVIDLVSP